MVKIDLLGDLIKEQKTAVTHENGPILVVAGAGTGKTTVITRRIAWLVEQKLAKPEEILALTFTEKAAAEMTSRVDELSEYIYSGLNISTFHSFGADLISEFALELGLPVDFKVLTDVEQILFIRDHIFDFKFNYFQNLSEPTSLIREFLKVFSRAKDELVDPSAWIENAKREMQKSKLKEEKEGAEKNMELAQAYATYNKLLRSEGYIDYGDQIMLVHELLKKPSCAAKIKKRYKFALIDEFQDTNWAQNELVKEIFGVNGNVMVVGDDDQSIYRFRGAAVSNILSFKENYKDVKTVVLNKNFRSTQAILDTAYILIQNNNPNRLEAKYQINKKLIAQNKKVKTSPPKLLLFETESQEAEAVAEEILKLNREGLNFGEIAVLFRANKNAEEFIRTFKKHGIPYVFSGAAGLYEKLEVKMLVSLVTALSDPHDDLALYHLSSSDVYGMNCDDLSKIARWAAARNQPLSKVFGSLSDLVSQLDLNPKTKILAEKILSDLTDLRRESQTSTAGEVINLFLRESGYYGKLTRQAKDGDIEANIKISNIAAFFDKIIHFQRNFRDHSLEKFAGWLALLLDTGEDPKPFEAGEGLDAVNVFTIHKSKGLEFETVFVSSLSDSHFPGRNRTERLELPKNLIKEKVIDDVETAEERRLFYVASTRAKNNLYYTAALDYGTKKTHKLSRFVIEALGKTVAPEKFLKTQPVERIKHFEKMPSLYNITLEPIPEREKLTFSRAAIDDWLTCPFKYQLIHVTPIRIVADANVAYGNAIHNTIGEYYKRKMAGKSVKKSDLLLWFDTFWDEAGFLSKIHEKKRYKAGIAALEKFYDKAEKTSLPVAVEAEFKFGLGNNIVKGRYDAVFEENGKSKIVDFKTSNVKKKEEADDRTKKSTQLAVYALSWQENKGKLPDLLQLYFVESGIVGEYIPTEKDIKKTKEDILTAASGIRKRDFGATPALMVCKYCPFKFYCPVAVVEKVQS